MIKPEQNSFSTHGVLVASSDRTDGFFPRIFHPDNKIENKQIEDWLLKVKPETKDIKKIKILAGVKSEIKIIEELNDGACFSVDSLIVTAKPVCLLMLTADCLPLVLYDPVKKVVAFIHVGWRQSLAGLVKKTLDVMINKYHVEPQNILAYFGPSIKLADVYTTGWRALLKGFFFKLWGVGEFCRWGKGNFHFDLVGLVKKQLINRGLLENKVEICKLSTVGRPDLFPSHCRERSKRQDSILTAVVVI